jgi:hypothetical protein
MWRRGVARAVLFVVSNWAAAFAEAILLGGFSTLTTPELA